MAKHNGPLPVQYLGARGTTHPCVEALVTILTSPYPCREITVIFCHPFPEADFDTVCFAVWDWLGEELTIVPDGFGTHNGTGGWGLEVILDLIQFYGVPLSEKWVEPEQFERIASGRITYRDRRQLHEQDHGAPSWPLNRGDFGDRLWLQLRSDKPDQFPYWLLEPELLRDVQGIAAHPGSALFRVVRRLEELIRAIGGYSAEWHGIALINEAMGKDKPFLPKGATVDEQLAWANLFRGAVGALRNPEGHRDQQMSTDEATAQILTVNMLVRKLKHDFPDAFQALARVDGGEQDNGAVDDSEVGSQ